MTCNKDCKTCMYGKAIPINTHCLSSGSTCNGDCKHCTLPHITDYAYKCNANTRGITNGIR